MWKRKFNKKLSEKLRTAPVTNFIKGQRTQCLVRIICRSDNITMKVVMNWKSYSYPEVALEKGS